MAETTGCTRGGGGRSACCASRCSIIVMDNTILNVAIPSLISDLDASNSEIQWIIDAYTLVFAGLLLTTGSLSDRFGRKGALQIGLVLFAIGSASAALSTTTVAADRQPGVHGHRRGADHAGDAVDPHQRLPRPPRAGPGDRRVGRVLRPRRRHRPGHRRAAAAPLRVELGVLGQPAARRAGPRRRVVPRADVEGPEPRRTLDPLGAVLSIVGLGALLFGIIEGPAKGWTDPLVLGCVRRRHRGHGVVHRLGAAHADADARHALLPEPALHRGQQRHHADVLRHVRVDVPDDPVLAVRPRLQPARRRPADDPLRHDDDGRRPDVGADRRARSAPSASSRPGC